MIRFALDSLIKWSAGDIRKPLIIRGARQVGKTWLMKEFGRLYYKQIIYISFDNNPEMKELFSRDFDISRIIKGLEIAYETKINPENTLLIFDEIQEAPLALTSLKYFAENAPEYQIVAAGSLLGVAMHSGTSFPVGKVDIMELHPLTYKEFLCAVGEDRLVECLNERDYEMITIFKDRYIDRLKEYYYIGGMPEVVNDFVQKADFSGVREIQNRILEAYELDFSKHAPYREVPRIRMIWNCIASQLSKENKKFVYNTIRESARAKDYELALLWLSDCGLIHKLSRVSKPYMPLKAYEDLKSFKIFLLDVGLLSALAQLDVTTLIKGNDIFTEFKGALTEQYVLQQIKASQKWPLFYWTNDNGNAEIDFILQMRANIIPIEAKASINLNSKSLKVYRENFKPEIALRTSMANYKEQDGLINLPLYAIEEIDSVNVL
ncbi:MAG: ATP-binding protein [Oscillospiraceae bacterium]|jgi:predicted AAA+ superfamily ATPase|nr:ATP-binding protein [Oscillospiraceae bacterium]